MNYQHRRSIDLMSAYASDQEKMVDRSLIAEERVMHAEATMTAPNEVKEIFEAFELVMKTPDELEEFLRAWESMPDEALLIY